jgi:hypothetical protein
MMDDQQSVTGTDELLATRPIDFGLYPNPATNHLNIDFSLIEEQKIEIGLIDLNGRLLHSLVHEQLQAGYHNKQVYLNDFNLASGLYMVTFRTNSSVSAKKLIYRNYN